MRKTYTAVKPDIKRNWYVIDAQNQILGRLAVKAAVILRGKNKPEFTPSADTGDGVIIVNASKVRVTGRKPVQKIYRRFSGYPGGLREVPLGLMLKNKPETVIRLAVKRMLPQGPLGRKVIKKLRVYSGKEFPHSSQKPIPIEV